jgi:hypothetical protein
LSTSPPRYYRESINTYERIRRLMLDGNNTCKRATWSVQVNLRPQGASNKLHVLVRCSLRSGRFGLPCGEGPARHRACACV